MIVTDKRMVNKATWYAGQPSMIYIWESMWRDIANRLDDERDEAFDEGYIWTNEQERKHQAAEDHWTIFDVMLDEAEQLRNNVRRMDNPFKWKFNLTLRQELKK